MSFDNNPRDTEPADRESYEQWEATQNGRESFVVRLAEDEGCHVSEAFYWNDELGWVGKELATVFSPTEQEQFRMPSRERRGIWERA
jgi:hypothetical protein